MLTPPKPINTAAEAWEVLRLCLDRTRAGSSVVVPVVVATLLLQEHDAAKSGAEQGETGANDVD